MTFDISQYSDEIANAEFDRVDRDFIEEGTHLVRIDGVPAITSQNTGNNIIILEAEIVSTDSAEHKVGQAVKHLFQLSGVDRWKVQRNLSQLKTIVAATLPAETRNLVTPDIVNKALNEGVILGAVIKVVAKKKKSKNDREYLAYSFSAAPDALNPETVQSDAPIGAGSWASDTNADANDDAGENVPF
jgi:hypothetical protein